MEHGTRKGYNHHGCRCDECRKANSEYFRDWYAERLLACDRDLLSDLLNELFPLGLTDQAPIRRRLNA